MKRIRLALAAVLVELAAVLVKFARSLLAGSYALSASGPETSPDVHEPVTPPPMSATEALAPPPTFEEFVAFFVRYSERAQTSPVDCVAFATFVTSYAQAIAPSLEAYRAAMVALSPPAPPSEPPPLGDVN